MIWVHVLYDLDILSTLPKSIYLLIVVSYNLDIVGLDMALVSLRALITLSVNSILSSILNVSYIALFSGVYWSIYFNKFSSLNSQEKDVLTYS